ncbi:MAG: winged helix-turn-helix domain-containing protein [Nitrososphaeraceae archaeon]|nr:winged helix-turn-helix domain-containing protein [Nitrososphaeraceae archaeon]
MYPQEKTAEVKYHEVHVYGLLHKWNFSAKVPRKRFCQYCIQ